MSSGFEAGSDDGIHAGLLKCHTLFGCGRRANRDDVFRPALFQDFLWWDPVDEAEHGYLLVQQDASLILESHGRMTFFARIGSGKGRVLAKQPFSLREKTVLSRLPTSSERPDNARASAKRMLRTSSELPAPCCRAMRGGTREPDVVTAMTLSLLYDLRLNKLFPRQGTLTRLLKKRERMLAAWRRTCQRPPGGNPGKASIIR